MPSCPAAIRRRSAPSTRFQETRRSRSSNVSDRFPKKMADKALEIVSMKNPADFGLDPNILAVGDRIVEVAGKPAEDQLDFHFHSSKGKTVSIRVQRKDGSEENILLPTRAVAGLEIWFEA